MSDASTDPPVYRLVGNLGIHNAKIRPEVKDDLKKRLHLHGRGWRDEPPTEVFAYSESEGYFWVPRFYFSGFKTGQIGKHRVQFEWTDGKPVDLTLQMTPDPARGQVQAIDQMERYLRENSGGILIAPTGCGKTLLGYAIGQRLKTSIGVLVYNGHMLNNWIETAEKAFGLRREDIGLVQSDQCDLGKPVTVMMVQSLLARSYPKELYQQIGFICADEVHRYGAPAWNEVMRQFPARYRLGLSADPTRDDGLDALIEWHFGKVGHKVVMATPKPAVVQILYKQDYRIEAYSEWDNTLNDGEGGWNPNPVRYDKCLQRDKGRNALIVEELVQARAKGRRILIFSRFNKHLEDLKHRFEKEWAKDPSRPATNVTMLIGGLKDDKLELAMAGHVVFTNYSFARDALNMPELDTLFFATPPGKPLQPIGRLRDKGPADRRPLLVVDFYELAPYSKRRAKRRIETYLELNHKVSQQIRNRRETKKQ